MRHNVKGWCPGALRPMEAGDGLMVRLRPRASRLGAGQALALADLAESHGSGEIDLGSRASLQLRGIRQEALPELRQALDTLRMLDADPAREARRNVLTTPIANDAETLGLSAALEAALAEDLAEELDLPAKFGFAVDTGARAILGGASADIRLERAAEGLIVRADGMALGERVSAATAVGRAMDIARWFCAHAAGHRRMATLIAAGGEPPLKAASPPLRGELLLPGNTELGSCVALPFGRLTAATLRALAVAPLRLTPWRSVLVEAAVPPSPDWIIDPADPRLRVSACPGQPACGSASVVTRDLALWLAPHLPGSVSLHVSGCAKGCAHPRSAALTLTGRRGRFDLIRHGRAGDPPALRDLSIDDVHTLLRGPLAPPL
ncbi:MULTISPECIES: cobalamin biosynthesis protein CobG [unclassified Haematobacter]|uniref:cobalamin biosynthesis protein CobG n=1 Tax=unclassified Haematobacter TaxID=2640585 RepID=UPI0025B96215|nr:MULTISPECIES: cobalamin biosynthesis protein CobG [unclassified Haematobacter]